MLCSVCKKNTAIIFINDLNKEGKDSLTGLCYDCAKEKGIDPLEVINKQNNIVGNDIVNLSDMSGQFENIFKDISKNLNLENLSNVEPLNPDELETDETGFPLGSIFAGFLKPNDNETENESKHKNSNTKNKTEKKKKDKKRKFLDTYGTNLTTKAKNNQLDIVVGRDKEIERMTQILNRRSKNNPCLIGEPGVGKTAIAQGLAIKIATGKVPAKLINKEVYLLDMTAIIAGTQFRGQFESRMKSLIDECKELGNIILVIDEIHNIIGAGDAEHSMNAANILKPSLANGEIQLIGTTTLREYRKYIEKDTALERRFQPIIVEEPNIDDSTKILEGIKKYYEDFHSVKISSDIIRQTVIMSEKYIHDRFLPDKAIDILDEACSRINLNNTDLYKLAILREELKNINEEKDNLNIPNDESKEAEEGFAKLAELKSRECNILEEIELDNPIFIEALPGLGHVGKLAADHMIDELNATKFAEIYSPSFPPQVLIKEDGIIDNMLNELYYLKDVGEDNLDLIILVGNTQALSPEGQYLVCQDILEFVKGYGISSIVTMGGMAIPQPVENPNVYGAATNEANVELLKEAEIGIRSNDGGIVGASGLFLGLGVRQGIEGICLMGETPGYFIDAESAEAILKKLSLLLNFEINTDKLDERAEETRKMIAKAQQMEQDLINKANAGNADDLRYIG